MNKTIIIALGGNALSPAGESGSIAEQFRHTRESLGAVIDLAAEDWHMAIVHGNGPQVGNALLRQARSSQTVPPLPLGVLVAGTAGWIGYMIQQSLQNALRKARIERQVVTVVTQVLIDPVDPTLLSPTKPIGKPTDERTAREIADEIGSEVTEGPFGWRCVIASPRPMDIIEAPMIHSLVDAGHIVIAAGGGGTPVYAHPTLGLEGLDAVVDKDRAAAILGRELKASVLLILTNVDGVYEDFGQPTERLIRRLTVDEASAMLTSGQLGAGSMAPKIEASVQFIRNGGRRAIIARLDQGRQAVAGQAGTKIVPD